MPILNRESAVRYKEKIMRSIKITVLILLTTLFMIACNSTRSEKTASTTPQPSEVIRDSVDGDMGGDYARDNLDLQAVGALLERSTDAENFEYLLNSDRRVNNLDLNGDGYVDYISVAEFDDRDTGQRGFTLFDRFGADDIQEIASLIFHRDRNDSRGARVLLNGNEQIHGDNYYYESNWLDKSLKIVDWAFGDRNDYYRSPYYYNNYPSNYSAYQVVETPVYRTRIREYYPEPVFVRTANPTVTVIKIKSSYRNRSINSIFAKLAKPTKEQKEFRENPSNRPAFVNKGARNDPSTKPDPKGEKEIRGNDKVPPGKNDKIDDRNKQKNSEKEDKKPAKPDKPGKKDSGE